MVRVLLLALRLALFRVACFSVNHLHRSQLVLHLANGHGFGNLLSFFGLELALERLQLRPQVFRLLIFHAHLFIHCFNFLLKVLVVLLLFYGLFLL